MEKHIPMRRCAGCMRSRPKSELIRIAFDGEAPVIDKEARVQSRGIYVCNSSECTKKAIKKNAFGRFFRSASTPQIEELQGKLTEITEHE